MRLANHRAMPTTKPARTAIPPIPFQPPCCPRPDCKAHDPARREPFRYTRAGWYFRQCDRQVVRRYRCRHCRRSFSESTFRTTYYLKRPELQEDIVAGIVAGSAHRQLARSLGCAPSTVTRQASRLGRHCLLFQAAALSELKDIDEPVVNDHFETFLSSQFDRLGIATPVGQGSWFVYGIDPAPHGRSGRVTRAQRRAAARRQKGKKKTPRGGYVQSKRRILDLLLGVAQGTLELVHDGHPAYGGSVSRHPERHRIRARAFPNPKRGPKGSPRSPEARARDEAMFAVDLLHGLWRHTDPHHGRERITFARRTSAVMERAHVLVVWRNFQKKLSERRSEKITPAMRVGLAEEPWSWPFILSRRLFPSQVRVPPGWMTTYRRAWPYPDVGKTVPHALKYAF